MDGNWLNEKVCANCGHSESRHKTAGGFCKHCTCNAFVNEDSETCDCDRTVIHDCTCPQCHKRFIVVRCDGGNPGA
jgi:hypothetical protein